MSNAELTSDTHSSSTNSATNNETTTSSSQIQAPRRASNTSTNSLNDFIDSLAHTETKSTTKDTGRAPEALNAGILAPSSPAPVEDANIVCPAVNPDTQVIPGQLGDPNLTDAPRHSSDKVRGEDLTETISLPLAEYHMLAVKAAVYDRLFPPSTPILITGTDAGIGISTPPPSEYTFPPDCALTITNLPQSLKLADLVHSLAAPGGIRYLRLLPAQGSSTALVVFPRATAARAYAGYVAAHGFFISRRSSPNARPSRGETSVCIQIGNSTPGNDGNIKRLWVLKRHIPSATLILPSTAPEGHGDPEYPRQSRCLRFQAPAEDVAREMGMFRPTNGRDVVIEHFSYFPRGGKDCTLIRFAGVRDAVVVRKYFEMLRGWEGLVESARDPCDKKPEALEWDGLRKMDDMDGGWVGGETLGGGELMDFSGKATETVDLPEVTTVKEVELGN